MYDIEETLLKDGFTDTDQSEESEQTFEEEGWPSIRYSYKVEQVELPELGHSCRRWRGASRARARGAGIRFGHRLGSGAGSDSGFDAAIGGFQDSALGGMLSMLGGGFGGGEQRDRLEAGRVVHPGPVRDGPAGPEGVDPQGHARR